MRRTFVCLICALWPASTWLSGDEPARVAPEDFAILAWRVEGDAELLRGVYECGFNLAGFVTAEQLDTVAAAGLKGVIAFEPAHADDGKVDRDAESIARDIQPIIEQTARHPAAYGYYVRDEPHARMFPVLGRYVEAFQQATSGPQPLINLFPNYASPEQLGTATYQEYLEKYVAIVKPPLVSYDHYALMDDGSLRDGYFGNLEAVRSVALANNLPFWNIVLSTAHFNYAEPTPAGLRFQAYTTMAYGGRGICYFTYMTPTIGNYRLGPIDQFGAPTPTWDMLREVNLQIHALVPTLVKLRSVGTFHHPDVPEGCRALADSKYVAALSGPGRFVVGEFEGPGGVPFVMVVNKDLHTSTHFDIRFRQPGKIIQTNSYTGTTGLWAGENNWLAAGQGMLLSLEQ